MIDLWPKIESKELITPVTILRQQASLLGKKTKNILEAEIKDLKVESVSDSDFHYAFYIAATALGFYRYKIMEIHYSMDLNPVRIEVEKSIYIELEKCEDLKSSNIKFAQQDRKSWANSIEVNSDKDFFKVLKAIFGSKKVLRVISVLLAQSDTGYDPSLKEETQQ
jgi:hypothetical protein